MARRWLVCALCLACGGQFRTEATIDAGGFAIDAGDAATCGSASDPRNCGACGHDCGGATCARGLCAPASLAVTLRLPSRLALDATYAYVTDQTSAPEGGRVLRVPKAGGAPVVLAGDESGAFAIAVRAGSLYWTRGGSMQANHADGSVRSMLLDGGSPATLQANAHTPSALAIDDTRVYWAETGIAPGWTYGGVRSIPLGGGASTSLVDTGTSSEGPSFVAIDGAYVYWTDADPWNGGYVARVPLGGGAIETIATTLAYPTCIVVDAESVYWVEVSTSHDGAIIMTASHSGDHPRKLWSGKPMMPIDLAVDGTALYWTEIPNVGEAGRIKKLPLAGGDAVTLAEETVSVSGIAVDETSVYWTTLSKGWESVPNVPETGAVKRVAK